MLLVRLRRALPAYLAGFGAPSAATAVMMAVNHYVVIPNISLLYIPAILFISMYFGTGPALTAAAVATVEYDFFLLNPLFTFTIAQLQDVVAFAIFAAVAALTSHLATRARERAEAAQRRALESSMLYELGQTLMTTHDMTRILQVMTDRIVEVFTVDRAAIFIPGENGQLRLAAETIQGARDRASEAAATYAYQRGKEVSLPADAAVGSRQRVYIPLRAGDRTLGVMEVGQKRSRETLDTAERGLLTSFAAQAALAIGRTQSEDERKRLTLLEESDRLKSGLLSAVSHDLRTPLASIKASATFLLSNAPRSETEDQELLHTIDQEADRLNRLVGNLLDLSRIQAGVLRPVLDWYDVQEVVDAVLPRLQPLLANHPFRLHVQASIPPVQLDLLRIEEMLFNLVENAVKYTPAGSPIELGIEYHGNRLYVEVVDHGPGVVPWQRERIFDTFYQGQQPNDRNAGTGLGLAICRGVAEAHGGRIEVRETPGGGATFALTLPQVLPEEARV